MGTFPGLKPIGETPKITLELRQVDRDGDDDGEQYDNGTDEPG